MKKFFTILLTIITTILLVLFILVSHLKEVVSDELVTSLIKDKVVTEITTVFNDDVIPLPDGTIEEIKKAVYENEEVNDILTKYVDETIAGITDEDSLDNMNIKKDIETLITEHKSIIEDELGITISDKDINKVVDKIDETIDLDKTYKEIIISEKEQLSSDQIKLINAYNFLISNNCRIILIISIIVCLLIIALIKKSLFKWLFNLSISNILAGVITFIGSFALGVFANYMISEKLNSSVSIELLPYLLSALAIFGIGILILIVYLVLRGIFKNNKELAK